MPHVLIICLFFCIVLKFEGNKLKFEINKLGNLNLESGFWALRFVMIMSYYYSCYSSNPHTP